VIYSLVAEAADYLIVHKFPGVPVHGPSEAPTLIEQLRNDFASEALQLAHRLDEGTSGLLIVAKHAEATSQLSQAFAKGLVQKRYLALSHKKPSKKQGWVIGDMQKVRDGNWKLLPSRENPAKTQFVSASLAAQQRLFVLAPSTGKTHQLRVALRALGAAICGDARYGGLAADRLYLHAWCLGFEWQGRFQTYCQAPLQGELFLTADCAAVAQQLLARLPLVTPAAAAEPEDRLKPE
jgi:tRNA pseudouridine32 synthase / 23S rRNA pseudouridine746 synthase